MSGTTAPPATAGPIFGELQQERTESLENILGRMIVADGNIQLKTELKRPMLYTKWYTLAQWFRDEGMDEVAELAEEFLDEQYKNLVSKERQGRKEIIQAVSDMNRYRREGIMGRLFGPGRNANNDPMAPPNRGY